MTWRGSMSAPTAAANFFELRLAGGVGVSLDVSEADRDDRSVLLPLSEGGEMSKVLCCYDQRHRFVAAIPETAQRVALVD
jgi:hypothetical protein